ncbi:MATE family efflux transporter [Parasedimentitalea maritima]|uniref:Multidrug export protein MepA n=1 Tax=Parasedimentitalea maritima TaxID=2578117 RepID=A0ABY2UU18_9RHOB|nr:MATE family efflux transporter [Zongyanglinia marina]TLP62801.1 MATE family efflux transporter [Zongyanglinia marina]
MSNTERPAHGAGQVADTRHPDNIYLSGPIMTLFLKTALPIVLVMLVNGLFTVVDAYFLGIYVGTDAVVAVTLMFPLYMMLIALSTLVSNGFSSVYARQTGAGNITTAQAVFTSAIQLSMLVCAILIIGFALLGGQLSIWVANGSEVLANLGWGYMAILIFCSPLVFVLAINIDALRAEGLLPAMTFITLLSAILNIVFDWLFVVQIQWGVNGSAYGTVLSQICAMAAILLYRHRSNSGQNSFTFTPITQYWRELLALGAPSSLGYIGLSLSAGVTLFGLQVWAGDHFEPTSGAFGIMTRLMTFTFLPLLGLSLAFQTIVGNNYGARQTERAHKATFISVTVAFGYCALVQFAFVLTAPWLGGVFINDMLIQQELARILPIGTLTLFLFGPLMMIAGYFQAVGDAARAAILGLSRTYLFAIPLTFALPFVIGEPGIWYAGVVAEIMVLAVTVVVLLQLRSTPQTSPTT